MAYELRELSGSLFKNTRKEKESHPNIQGSCMIEGVEYWISGWTKTTKDGEPWISLAFKAKDAKPTQEADHRQPPKSADTFADLDDGPAF